jgi:hypothetical protein
MSPDYGSAPRAGAGGRARLIGSIVALLCFALVRSAAATSPWPMHGQNPQRSGQSPLALAAGQPYRLWKYDLGANSYTQPAIGHDGTLYATNDMGKLVALSPQGQLLWTHQGEGPHASAPAVAPDGTVYYGAGQHVYSITPGGIEQWSYDVGIGYVERWIYAPHIDGAGNVHVGTRNGHFALRASGQPLWHFPHNSTNHSAALPSGDVLAVGVFGSLLRLTRLEAMTGGVVWHATFPASTSSPVVAPDGSIFLAEYGGAFFRVNAETGNATQVSTLPLDGPKSLSVATDGLLYINADDGIMKVTPDGQVVWTRLGSGGRSGGPLIDAAETILAADGQLGSEIKAYTSDGTPLWNFTSEEPGWHFTSPILGSSGVLYATEWSYNFTNGYVYAIAVPEPAAGVAVLIGGAAAVGQRRRARVSVQPKLLGVTQPRVHRRS